MKNKIKFLVVITFIIMIVINALANALPINGMDTGAISDAYPNLFAPAGITFSIWGVIYLLLGLFTYYQLDIKKNISNNASNILEKICPIFIFNAIINSAWIFSWHYQIIPLSLLLMIALLISLIKIVNITNTQTLDSKEKFFIKLPFSIYFGWITVATIANVTILLVSLNWNGFGIPQNIWSIIIISIGAIIGILTILKNKDYFYGLVIIWAYCGIIIKHTTFFNGQYKSIIITTAICIALVAVADIYAIQKKEY